MNIEHLTIQLRSQMDDFDGEFDEEHSTCEVRLDVKDGSVSVHWKADDGKTYQNGPLLAAGSNSIQRRSFLAIQPKLGGHADALDQQMCNAAHLLRKVWQDYPAIKRSFK